ncbi:MAG: DUF4276 family protein [Gammaproteobacteria bacterium]|nr:DUF4276 family protein [Gammaproteobacteria bacterium]
MTRLLVHVEGETEESFVNEVLAGHLAVHGYASVAARLLGNARARSRRGGIRSWPTVRRDIMGHLREDTDGIATIMVGYYGLPQDGDGAWPGRADAPMQSTELRAATVEQALLDDVTGAMGAGFDTRRFVPFVLMHEFEALLFSDCVRFADAIGQSQVAGPLQAVRAQFATPEEIDDSPETAPSKRIQGLVPGYGKAFMGILGVLEIGLARIRSECRHFDDWLVRLEQTARLATGPAP